MAQSQPLRKGNWNNFSKTSRSGENPRFHGRNQNGFRGIGRSGFGRGRGRSDRPICQFCLKVGHLALDCWHRFDRQYTNSVGNLSDMQYVPH